MGRMRTQAAVRTLGAASLVLSAGLVVACGGDPEPGASVAPADVPSGFVVQRGAGWTLAHPRGWKRIAGDAPKGQMLAGFESPAGSDDLPSQIGVGVNPEPANDWATARRLGRDMDEIRYPDYAVRSERALELPGAKRAVRTDAVYRAFTERRSAVRVVEVLAERDDGGQVTYFVRGPEADFASRRLDEVLATVTLR